MQSEAKQVQIETEENAEKMMRGHMLQANQAVQDRDSSIAQLQIQLQVGQDHLAAIEKDYFTKIRAEGEDKVQSIVQNDQLQRQIETMQTTHSGVASNISHHYEDKLQAFEDVRRQETDSKNQQLENLHKQQKEAADTYAQKTKELEQQNASEAFEKTRRHFQVSNLQTKMRHSDDAKRQMREAFNAHPTQPQSCADVPGSISEEQVRQALKAVVTDPGTSTQEFDVSTPRATSAERAVSYDQDETEELEYDPDEWNESDESSFATDDEVPIEQDLDEILAASIQEAKRKLAEEIQAIKDAHNAKIGKSQGSGNASPSIAKAQPRKRAKSVEAPRTYRKERLKEHDSISFPAYPKSNEVRSWRTLCSQS